MPSTRGPAPAAPPSWLWIYLLLGALLGGSFAAMGSRRAAARAWLRRSLTGVATVWASLVGLVGTILVALLFTDHTFAWGNENLFLANPLLLLLAIALPAAGLSDAWRPRARWLAAAVLVVAVVGLAWQILPFSRHANAIFFALMLPAHAGLAWGLRRAGPASEGPAAE